MEQIKKAEEFALDQCEKYPEIKEDIHIFLKHYKEVTKNDTSEFELSSFKDSVQQLIEEYYDEIE